MQDEFLGYHSEWNMGSPGGWDYQRMAQENARFSWQKIKEASGIDIELDFNHPILNPVPEFANLLLEAHQRNLGREKPSIALVAERETLDKVGENIHFIQYLNSLPDTSACLISPDKLELKNNRVLVGNDRIKAKNIIIKRSKTKLEDGLPIPQINNFKAEDKRKIMDLIKCLA